MKTLYFFAALSSFALTASDLTSYQQLLEQDKFTQLQQQLGNSTDLNNKELLVLQLKTMLGLRQSEQAEQLADRALAKYPEDAELLHLAGINQLNQAQDSSFLTAGSYAKAGLDFLQRAVKADPSYLQAQHALIGFYLQAPAIAGGDTGEAKKLAAAMAATHQPDGTLAQVDVLLDDDKLTQALQLLEQQLQQHPEHPTLVGTYANLLSLNKDHTTAFAQYKKAAQLASDLSEQQSYYYQLGRLAATEHQDPLTGQQALEGYLAFYQDSDHPRLGWAKLRLAQIYLIQQQQNKAEQLLQQLDPQQQDDDRLQKELKKLTKQLKKS